MMTYLLLNLIVLAVVLIVLARLGALRWNLAIGWTLVVLFVTTAVFDSLIIYADIVAYNSDHYLGVRLGLAPIEDFFYALVAGLVIPGLWLWLEKRQA